MIIKKENIDKVLNVINKNCEEYGIEERDFDALLMSSYRYTLDTIANKSNYQEGQKISEEDLNTIKEKVNSLITTIANEIKKKETKMDHFDKMYFNGFDTLMAATDYLYAMAMERLGCPDIPASFGADVCNNNQKSAKELDTLIKKSYFDNQFPTKTYFDKQRKKDADEVRRKNKDLIKNCNSQIATTEQLAELVAEYQALNLRQKGHGRIWRFFHGEENDKRTQLLEDMKAAISKAVGENVNLEPTETTPSNIAILFNKKLIEKKAIEYAKPDIFASRYNIEKMVKYDQSELMNKSNENNIDNAKPQNNIEQDSKLKEGKKEIVKDAKEYNKMLDEFTSPENAQDAIDKVGKYLKDKEQQLIIKEAFFKAFPENDEAKRNLEKLDLKEIFEDQKDILNDFDVQYCAENKKEALQKMVVKVYNVALLNVGLLGYKDPISCEYNQETYAVAQIFTDIMMKNFAPDASEYVSGYVLNHHDVFKRVNNDLSRKSRYDGFKDREFAFPEGSKDLYNNLTGKRQNIDIDSKEVDNNDLLVEPNNKIEEVQNSKDKSNII